MSKKLSEINTSAVDSNTYFVGLKNVSGTFTDYSFPISDMADYIASFAGGTPVVAAVVSGAGVGSSANVVGADMSLVASVTTGTSCGGSSAVFTIAFSAPLSAAPIVVLVGGANDDAADLSSTKQVRVKNITVNGFQVHSGSTPLDDATQYDFFCLVKP